MTSETYSHSRYSTASSQQLLISSRCRPQQRPFIHGPILMASCHQPHNQPKIHIHSGTHQGATILLSLQRKAPPPLAETPITINSISHHLNGTISRQSHVSTSQHHGIISTASSIPIDCRTGRLKVKRLILKGGFSLLVRYKPVREYYVLFTSYCAALAKRLKIFFLPFSVVQALLKP